MNRRYLLVAGSLLVTLTVVAVFSQRAPEVGSSAPDQSPRAGKADQVMVSPAEVDPSAIPGAVDILSEEQMQLLEDPRVIRFSRDLEFQQQVNAFFEQASQLSGEERARQAARIEDQLEGYRTEGKVSGPEALLLRLALVRTTEQDTQRQEAASRALIQEYQREADQRVAQWQSRNQPEFDRYKRKERSIVEDVMSMETIPGDMDRNEYLRQRLQQARIEAMDAQQ